MKKTMIALVATIMAATCIFFACSKDERTERNNGHGDMVQNGANPYNFVGILHNEAMDFTFAKHQRINVSDEEIHSALQEFLQDRFENMEGFPNYDEMESEIEKAHLTSFEFLTSGMLPVVIPENEELSIVLKDMYQLLGEIMENDELPTPNAFSDRLSELERLVINHEQHSIPNGNSEMNPYDMVLANLSIARYSYQFWYSAAMEESCPYHEEFVRSYLPDGTEACSGEFCEWVKGSMKKPWNSVVSVATFVTKDISAFTSAYALLRDPDSNTQWTVVSSIAAGVGSSISEKCPKK